MLGCSPLGLLDDIPNPSPSSTAGTPQKPTETRNPKGTVSLDYEDMLIPRKKTQDAATRKEAVDSLFKNMCLGMKERGALDTQTEIFTYTRSQQSANRREACGGVTCDPGESCDEYPFASTAEGGAGAIANCIIELGNSIQGGFLSTLLRGNMINENDHYTLELKNVKCEELLASPKKRDILHARQPETSGLTTQLQEIDMYTFGPFISSDVHNHSLYYIGDLSSGNYTERQNKFRLHR
ncbi:hypothetical protein GALMADRAFT_1125289 [Galerina marginata CBS 339.88]|uniref:Deoxyribonuclease NucA/NucB domain-containing protein n=1 Tax=Galerina marginata (strain CBS 339.88) TaxID=685588 RepID=A0A067TQP5_GALM3|nr:hypothetical protein GALMADRAFT_1125289 [Galerina marginata CBS 339.88]